MRFSLPECEYCGDECRETHDVLLTGFCSAECKAAAKSDGDECDCPTCHSRWLTELNK